MSAPLTKALGQIEAELNKAPGLALFLDFDGTLAPLVDDPDRAELPSQTRLTLEELARLENVAVVVISGRAVRDLRSRVGLELIYAGCHGLEISGPGLQFSEPVAESLRPRLEPRLKALTQELRGIPGVLVQDKGLTLSVHFRRVSLRDRAELTRIVTAWAPPQDEDIVVRQDTDCFEVLPRVEWHKGYAALWIREQMGWRDHVFICAGDDATDEDLYRCLPDAISVKVGWSPSTAARFYTEGPAALRHFLAWLWGVRLLSLAPPGR